MGEPTLNSHSDEFMCKERESIDIDFADACSPRVPQCFPCWLFSINTWWPAIGFGKVFGTHICVASFENSQSPDKLDARSGGL